MNDKNHQVKVQDVGDPHKTGVIPSIKVQGKWLLDTGISPNDHVIIENPENGTLIIKVISITEGV